jgi:hypothetical protein
MVRERGFDLRFELDVIKKKRRNPIVRQIPEVRVVLVRWPCGNVHC